MKVLRWWREEVPMPRFYFYSFWILLVVIWVMLLASWLA